MSGFIEGNPNKDMEPLKRFGYITSAILIVISTVSMMNNWQVTPWLFLLTMYFLTSSLWIPFLIKPFYLLLRKMIGNGKEDKKENDKYFNPN